MVGISAERSSVCEVHVRCSCGGGDLSAERSSAHVVHMRCTCGGWDRCRKVKCACGACVGHVWACVVHVRCTCDGGDLSAERSSAHVVHMRCTCGGGDKCRKVKCTCGAHVVHVWCM